MYRAVDKQNQYLLRSTPLLTIRGGAREEHRSRCYLWWAGRGPSGRARGRVDPSQTRDTEDFNI